MLRALSLCTCCHHYPGTASGRPALLFRPAVSAFPDRVVGSACASSFSRFAQCSLTLRPAHSRCHQFVTRFTRRLQPFRFLHDCSGCFRLEHFAGRGLHPLESAAFSRRTPIDDIAVNCWYRASTGDAACRYNGLSNLENDYDEICDEKNSAAVCRKSRNAGSAAPQRRRSYSPLNCVPRIHQAAQADSCTGLPGASTVRNTQYRVNLPYQEFRVKS